MSRRPRRAEPHAGSQPDSLHGCAKPERCTRAFCAAPVHIDLVSPEETRVVVRALPGWPVSASALVDRLNARVGRAQLLYIVGSDPFGAHEHFPILVRIQASGRVPPRLRFDAGEALRLTRNGDGPHVDHLARAWSCALLAISGFDDVTDDLTYVAGPLVQSCLALGGDAPRLAEELMAWRAVTEEPTVASRHANDYEHGDPAALLAILLLRAATDPTDARLANLARTIVVAFTAEPQRPAPLPMRRPWRRLVTDILEPLRQTDGDIARLITIMS